MNGKYSKPRKKRRNKNILPVLLLSCLLMFGIGKVSGFLVRALASTIVPEQTLTQGKGDSPTHENKETKKETVKTSGNQPNSKQWMLLLVNSWNPVRDDFEVERTTLKNGHSIDKRAYPDLQQMLDDAREKGLSPLICSSYRTVERQEELFQGQVDRYLARGYSSENAKQEASKWVAVPGTSEHHTGLALDIVSESNQRLEKAQENTPEQKWLMENSWRYGFILRYPQSKSEITGIEYEPWHYRYVGKEAAKKIFEQGICLEEYLKT